MFILIGILFVLMTILFVLVYFHVKSQPVIKSGLRYNGCNGFSNIGGSITSLTLSPDPLRFGQKFTVSVDATFVKQLQTGSRVIVQVWTRIFGIWITMFQDDLDGCSLLKQKYANSNSTAFYGSTFPHSCPVPTGSYHMNIQDVMDDSTQNTPCWIKSGIFNTKVFISDGPPQINGQLTPFACEEVWLEITC
jgi:hypothetical protein